MSGSFDGVSVLVTGGTRGIGRALVAAFAREGAKVTFTGTNPGAAEEAIAASGHPDLVKAVMADVRDAAAADAAVSAAVEHGGGLDVVINNAGITRDGLFLRMGEDDWDAVMGVNLKGSFLVTKAAARRLMKSARGRVINITSVVGLVGNAGQVNYSASKAGLLGFTKSLARELAGRAVTVNAVAPGYIETDMTAELPEGAAQELKARIPLGRLGTVDDIAEVVLFLASPAAGYITGQVIPVAGGMVV